MFIIFGFLLLVNAQQENFVPIKKDSNLPKTVGLTVLRPGETKHRVFEQDGITYTEIKRVLPSGGIQTAHVEGKVAPMPSLIFPTAVKSINLTAIMSRVQNNLRSNVQKSFVYSKNSGGLLMRIGNMTDGVLNNVFALLLGP